ncbi:MAG: polysaccharide biosynthesis tyrosine autokinase [Pseudomonadota bacterium]
MDQSPIPAAQRQHEEDVIDIGALFGTLWRGKWLIALITALALVVGAAYAFVLATPIYRATAVVILQTNQDQIVDLQSVVGGLSGDTTEVNSEVEVLRARSLMGKVVDRLSLTEDPEFNVALLPPGALERATDRVRMLLGAAPPAVSLSPEEAEQRTRDAVTTALLEAVSVRNVPLSLVFRVTVESVDARKAARIADTIVDLYILNQIEVKFEATEQATLWLSGRVAELQVSLEAAESEVSAFSASTDLVSLDGIQALERQIKELRDRLDNAEAARAALSAQLAALESAETREAQVAIAEDPALTRAFDRLRTDASFSAAFDARLALVLERKRADLARATQQIIALEASEEELAADLDQQGADLIELQQLTREAEATRVLYEYFLTRFNETSAQQGIQQADSRVLSNAVIPNSPSEPRKSMILAMAGVLGLLVGIGYILLREARNNTFRTAADLERSSGLTVMGQIPRIPASSRRKALEYLRDKPMSEVAEAYRNLRTSLMLAHLDNPPKVIVFTSSVPGEGKTTNSIALAQNLIGLGKKVLLVEGDIRRRTFSKYFDNLPQRGLISVLSGDKSLADGVMQAPGLGADILVGERTSTNAADVFSSETFKRFVQDARESYDAVIIDTPPILVVPDARIIAEQADAVIFTVRWDHTSRQQFEESLRLFRSTGQKITGLLLGQINPRGMKRYGYGGRYGAYAGYGSKYYAN